MYALYVARHTKREACRYGIYALYVRLVLGLVCMPCMKPYMYALRSPGTLSAMRECDGSPRMYVFYAALYVCRICSLVCMPYM